MKGYFAIDTDNGITFYDEGKPKQEGDVCFRTEPELLAACQTDTMTNKRATAIYNGLRGLPGVADFPAIKSFKHGAAEAAKRIWAAIQPLTADYVAPPPRLKLSRGTKASSGLTSAEAFEKIPATTAKPPATSPKPNVAPAPKNRTTKRQRADKAATVNPDSPKAKALALIKEAGKEGISDAMLKHRMGWAKDNTLDMNKRCGDRAGGPRIESFKGDDGQKRWRVVA